MGFCGPRSNGSSTGVMEAFMYWGTDVLGLAGWGTERKKEIKKLTEN